MLRTLSTENLTVNTDVVVELGNTMENLQTSINGEAHEHEELYPEFSKIAKEEGLDEISKRIDAIILSEKHHKERFQKLLNELKNNSLHNKEEEAVWFCRKCGYETKGKSAPDECPSCSHPKGYFQVQNENY
jgi:rubrerythrin